MLWLFLAVLVLGFWGIIGAINHARDVLYNELERLRLSLPGQPDNSETLGTLDEIHQTLQRIEGQLARDETDGLDL